MSLKTVSTQMLYLITISVEGYLIILLPIFTIVSNQVIYSLIKLYYLIFRIEY